MFLLILQHLVVKFKCVVRSSLKFFKSAQPCYKTLFCWYQTTEQLVSSGCETPQFILILRNKSHLNFRIQPREHWNPTQHAGNSQSFSLIVPFTYLGIRLESSGLNSDCFITCQNSLFYISCIFCFSSQVLLRIFLIFLFIHQQLQFIISLSFEHFPLKLVRFQFQGFFTLRVPLMQFHNIWFSIQLQFPVSFKHSS